MHIMSHSNFRRIQKLLLLLFALILLSISFVIYHWYFQSVKEVSQVLVPPVSLEENTLYLYDYLPSTSDHTGNDAISWWYSEADHFYYFFLPSQAKDHPVRVAFSSGTADTIIWGDQTYRSGDVVAVLTSGQIAIIMGEHTYPVNVLYGDNLSTMMIHTASHSMEQVDSDMAIRETGTITISDSVSSYYYDGDMSYIKGRGNSSFGYDKKSYQIRLPDKQAVCGMGSAKKWILLPQYFDKTAVRNPVTFALADALGLQYTPDYRYVNLYLNGAYHGLYLLTEKVEVSQSRIKIRDLDKFLTEPVSEFPLFGESDYVPGTSKGYLTGIAPDDMTGGYLLELELPERYASAGECGFVTTRGQAVIIKSPEYASKEEVAYISSWYQDFEDALYAEDGKHPDTGRHYSDYVDMDSLVAKYLVEEYVLNPDAGKTSQFFYKPNDAVSTKMYAGPVWDYDLALGCLVAFSHPEGLWAAYPDDAYNIYAILSQHDDFILQVKDMYQGKLLPYLQDTLPEFIQKQAVLLKASAHMSSIRWNTYDTTAEADFEAAYETQFDQLSAFLTARADYLSSKWLYHKSYHIVTVEVDECDYFYLGTDYRYTVADGSCIDLYDEPVKYGYTFEGFLNKATGKVFDLHTPITEDNLILTPIFSEN